MDKEAELRIVRVASLSGESYDVTVCAAGFGARRKDADWHAARDYTFWVMAFGKADGGEVVDAGYRSYDEARAAWPHAT